MRDLAYIQKRTETPPQLDAHSSFFMYSKINEQIKGFFKTLNEMFEDLESPESDDPF